MNKYVMEIGMKHVNSAGSKAKDDVVFFLKRRGFISVKIRVLKNRLLRLILGKILVFKALRKIKTGVFIFQYPVYSKIISKYVLQELKKKNISTVLVIHDVESLRLSKTENSAINAEIEFFNQFDKVISHNIRMTKWLETNGITTKVSNLNIFDYNNPCPISIDKKHVKEIKFAGNLKKSSFLENLNIKTHFSVMGPFPAKTYPKNVDYIGEFTPEKVPTKLNSGFGLVWDGTSIKTCNGLFGGYMRVDNPHKVSLYLSSGLPVIIWSQAAMADFIIENNLGIAINSLEEIDMVLDKMSNDDYALMIENVNRISRKLRNGDYIYDAILN